MGIAIQKNIIDQRHRFDTIPMDMPLEHKTSRLSAACFAVDAKEYSLPFGELVSTKQETEHFSPSATNNTIPCADLFLLRSASQLHDLHLIKDAWIGAIFDIDNQFIFLHKATSVAPTMAYMALYHFPHSAVLAWPGKLMKVEGHPTVSFFQPDHDIAEPTLMGIFSLVSGIKATSFRWRSWLWQWHNLPLGRKNMKPGIRAIIETGTFDTLDRVAAKKAFWSIDKAVLFDYAGYFGIAVDSAHTLL
jgi:hypothetical protein